MYVCVRACVRAISESIQTDPPSRHKSINTIEVLILPPLWAICSFKSHLAEANLTFNDEDFDLSVLIFSLTFFFRYLNDFPSRVFIYEGEDG